MSTRREFIKLGGAGAVGLAASRALAAGPPAPAGGYPVIAVAPLERIVRGAVIPFTYPDAGAPAVLLRLGEAVLGGVGPNREIVAFSALCTHKGCPVSYKPEHRLIICPCHWSTFDPAKSGELVIGQASQNLPQIELRIDRGLVQAIGVSGLIYGRHTNVV
jgi:arsenite oxidase small subunit